MALSYFHPSVSNCFSLSLDGDYVCVNDSQVNLIFKNIGNVDFTSNIYTYDNTTGYIALNKRGKYLLTFHLSLISPSAVSTGNLTIRYGSNLYNSYTDTVFTSTTSNKEFAMNGSFIFHTDDNDVAYLSLQNVTDKNITVVGAPTNVAQKPSYMQLIYLGP